MLRADEQIKKDVVDQLFWDRRPDAASIDTEYGGLKTWKTGST
jgi:hypothetical protein